VIHVPSNLSIAEAADIYLRHRRARFAAGTVGKIERVLREVAEHFARRAFIRITPDDMADYWAIITALPREPRGEPATAGTARNWFYVLKSFTAWSADRKYCQVGMMREIHLPPPPPRKDYLYLTADELIVAIEDAANPRNRFALALLANTAGRAKEICRINVGHLDLDNDMMYYQPVKGGQTDRMPITAELRQEIGRWLPAYSRLYGGQLTEGMPLVPGIHAGNWGHKRVVRLTGRRASPNALGHAAQAMLRGLGYTDAQREREGTHTIRRSVARLAFDAAAESGSGYSHALAEVAALLHHKSTVTTERYIGLTPGRVARDTRMKGQPFLTPMRKSGRPEGQIIRLAGQEKA